MLRKFLINSPTRKLNRHYLRHRLTPAEKIIWQNLKSKKLGFWFKRQVSFGPYFLDFYCPSRRLIVEIDGEQHNLPDSKIYDDFRTEYLSSFNLKVMRFKNSEVLEKIDQVISQIGESLATSP